MSFTTFLSYALPHRLLSKGARKLAHSRRPWLKDRMIGHVASRYGVDLSEAKEENPAAYACFNDFFTRELKPGARVPDAASDSVLMPADGRISQLGAVENGRIFQVKGQWFTAQELLGSAEDAAPFDHGAFATIYLSPRDYHRIHMPWAGTLRETLHVPGRLFSVGTAAMHHVPRLFARNERLACHFDTDFGSMVVVMVGAMLVSGIETVWGGVEVPPYARAPIRKNYREKGIALPRFAEMGRFNFGSTVIVLLPPGVVDFSPEWVADAPVRVGQRLGVRTASSQSRK